jgi:predicted outer membrane repeat protein
LKRLGTRSAVGAGAALGAAALVAPSAEADTFTVTSTADDGSDGTLRKEIQDANANGLDDVITFASGLSGTITLSSADGGSGSDIEIINEGLQIQGPGPGQITVDGADTDRIFTLYSFLAPDEQVSISGLTLTGGDTSAAYFGGAVYSGGGATDNAAELTISNSVLTDNHTDGGGGAVFTSYGSLTVLDSTFSANSAGQFGGALYTGETDGDQPTEVVIRNSTISDNDAGLGSGGFATYDADGNVLIEGSTIAGNEAQTDGGGLGFATDNGTVTIQNSTISGNEAVNSGGGINLGYVQDPVVIQNSTVSGNSAGIYGGGIRSTYNRYDAERTVRNSTVTANSADEGGGIFSYRYDSPDYAGDDNFTLSSTIVANNSAVSEGPDLGQYDGSSDSFVVGFSLVENTSDATIADSPAGSNLFGVDPQLGTLAPNGGPTQTHLPAITSPAVDAGTTNGLAADQRGLARPFDASNVANGGGSDGADIGAVELAATGSCKGAGATVLFGPGSPIDGSEGADVIVATGAAEQINGLGGNDAICAGGGNDKAKGGAGKDRAFGEGGKDRLKGNAGKDKLSGDAGKDKLAGGGGKDKLKGGAGKDKIVTGGGKDKVNCGGGKDKVNADPKDRVAANCETLT